MMTFAALVVAAILVASTLYAMFSRTMSDLLPLRRTRFLTRAAGRLTSRNHRPVGPSPRIKNLILVNR